MAPTLFGPGSSFPLLLLFLIALFSLALSDHHAASSVNPSTSSAATVRYWNRKVHNNASHPSDFLLSLLSPLPITSLSSSPLSISPSFCRSARLLCPDSTFSQPLESSNSIFRFPSPPAECSIQFVYSYNCGIAADSSSFTPGVFFRETELTTGNVMPMADRATKMPARSFLPRSIARMIPFKADAIKSLFRLDPGTTLAKAVDETLAACQKSPVQGETRRCATSAEDMIDFAVEALGSDIVVRSTESPNSSGGPVMIGKVKGINGGKVTKSVSCHQYLFPYMVYYCHSMSNIKVYEAEILSVETKKKINRGVAVCHLDTSAWDAGHPAFVAVGGKPGQIEVCHWIFNGDMTWVTADKS